jgi:hypothetical protein
MFRLSIRDLFWLMMVVAPGTAWWLDHRKVAELEGVVRGNEIGMAMMAERIELLSDAATQNAIDRGEFVMAPIYADEEEAADLKVRRLGSD